MCCSHVESSDGTYQDFAPSTDLNDAFWAAEQTGLFMCHTQDGPGVAEVALYQGGGGYWWIGRQRYSQKEFESVSGETPALAICAAILKLKGSS